MNDSEQIVYISCVEEVRFSFVSHLSEALYQKGISDVFVDSKDLLSEEAQEMVERARVSVVILPGNRTVCLDKLLKVLGCQRNKYQVVVPVLYGDSPLQVEWRSALDSEGLLSVHRSRNDCTDSDLVKEITIDVYEKLFYMEQVGIYSKLLEIESLVCKQPFGVRCVGIWGMPGIGKTTLAKAVYNHLLKSGDFGAYCFIEDCDRVIYEKGLYRLLVEQFSKEKPGAGGSITKMSLLRNKLNNTRVLVVLDDVRDPLMAEPLLGGSDWFGPKSLIIITSRDKQVFRLCRVDQIYEVKSLNEKEALQLFLLSASIKDKGEQILHHELSMKVIEYANGNPLALSTYGRELKGKKKLSEMEIVNAFLELKRHPHFEIVNAFKSSYDTLSDSEKNIFLDIACFFNGENVDYVMQLLEGCGFFPHVGIDVLVEKCLVTISDNRVRMHNVVQDIGREILNGETVQSRLWEPCSIKSFLEDNEPKTTCERAQGTKEIKGMFLDTENLSFDVKPAAFENMLNLRLLKIYCSDPEIHPVIKIPNGSLHSLPNELRLLHWENYPLRCLPPNFDPLHLVEINMPYSQLEKLWGGNKNLEMLRTIRLCHSQQLFDVGYLSKAQNLEVVDLQGCTRLQSFPATGQLLHLRVVNLSGCSDLKTVQGFPRNLKELYLSRTAIRKVPQLPQSLELLNANGCVSLKSIRLDSKKFPMHYTFSNCFDLSPFVVSDFLVKVLANAKHIPRERQQELNDEALAFSFCGPSHPNQNSTLDLQLGSSVAARLNPSWRNTLVGFAMLVEVSFSEDYCGATGFGIRCVCRWKNKEGHSQRIERNMQCWAPENVVPKAQKDHIFVFVDVNMRPSTDEGNDPNIWADLVVFEFFPVNKQTKPIDDSCTVTKCGVRVINAATGNSSPEAISPVFSLDPMEVSGNEVEEVLRVRYDGLEEMNKVLFHYIACLFNDEDVDLMKPFITGIDVDVGLKVLADRSLIRVSSNGEIVMDVLLRRIGKELSESMLPGGAKKNERLVGNSQNSMISTRKIEVTHSENPENWKKDPSYVPVKNFQTAMARLEEEFKHLLVENRLPFELEHSSFRSIEADHGVEEGSMASFGAASTEDLILGSSNSRRNSAEIVVDLINPDVISDLKNIADTMIASGYDRECIQVCTMVRKDALDEFLYNYEVEKLSIEDVLKMDWATLNTNIKKWVRVMRKLVQIYLLSEKSLGNQIFGELNEIGLLCFVDTVKAPMMLLLNFGEAVSLGPRQPEKLLRILEMYELASELLPEIDALFMDHPGSSVRSEYREVMRRLGDCARATFLEFKSKIASDVSSHPFPGGAIHPLTNYVMNYLMALTDFSYTLDSLLMEHDDVEDLTIPPSPDIINPVMIEEESTYENSSSPEKFLAMTRHFYTITSVLEANLQEKSKLYRDVSLRHIFLLNNIHYMSRKVLKSELRHIFGDKWIRKHTWKFQQQATEYERATWLPVLSFLKEDSSGSGSGSGSGSRNLRPRERFQGFNTAFEEVYKTQTGWLISDESLREEVRTKASMWVIQAYWTFYSRHKNSVGDRYIKYSTDDLEKLLLDLFAGSSKSLNNSYRR